MSHFPHLVGACRMPMHDTVSALQAEMLHVLGLRRARIEASVEQFTCSIPQSPAVHSCTSPSKAIIGSVGLAINSRLRATRRPSLSLVDWLRYCRTYLGYARSLCSHPAGRGRPLTFPFASPSGWGGRRVRGRPRLLGDGDTGSPDTYRAGSGAHSPCIWCAG